MAQVEGSGVEAGVEFTNLKTQMIVLVLQYLVVVWRDLRAFSTSQVRSLG